MIGLAFLLATAPAFGEDEDLAFFEAKVRPILAERCFKCHGPEQRKAALRLDSRAGILAGGDGGPAAEPGRPEESLLIQAIGYADEPRMPPDGKLPEGEISALAEWVRRGLPWPESAPAEPAKAGGFRITQEQRDHWSFRPLSRPEPPAIADPGRARNAVDRFILAKIDAAGLAPAPRADRLAWLRRVALDLTGIPPTPAEADEFLRGEPDKAAADAVDRLLASPRYGERWGRHWLDLVRYADSRDARGQGGDTDIGEAYRYRDWVVSALNRDMPYDQFIRMQVAGDVLATRGEVSYEEGLVATGLLTLGEWGTGDADKEKMLTDIVADQVDVVSRPILGVTLACARCHDHKFDPFSQRDYYGLAGIFFSTRILPAPGIKTGGSPMLRTPLLPPSELKEIEGAKALLAKLEADRRAEVDRIVAEFARSLRPKTADYLLAAWEAREADRPALEALAKSKGLHAFAVERWRHFVGLGRPGQPLQRPVIDAHGFAGYHQFTNAGGMPFVGINTAKEAVKHLTYAVPPRSIAAHPGPSRPVAIEWKAPIAGAFAISGRIADGDPVGGNGASWRLASIRSGLRRELASGDIQNGAEGHIPSFPPVSIGAGERLQLIIEPKADHGFDTTIVEFRLADIASGRRWDVTESLLAHCDRGREGPSLPEALEREETWSLLELEEEGNPSGGGTFSKGSTLELFAGAIANGTDSTRREAAAGVQAAILAGEEDEALRGILDSPASPFYLPAEWRDEARTPDGLREALRDPRQAEREQFARVAGRPIPVALAAQEGGVPQSAYEGIRDGRLLIRGNYRRPGEVVPRGVPEILGDGAPLKLREGSSGREELARWLTDPENPLTPRVIANRIWLHHFGQGLVRTPSNFGKLGEPPTHPELLDFLANSLIESGWSLKSLHRLILTSATYAQSSKPAPGVVQADPENRLFSRATLRRLGAEELRDGILAASGKLDETMGGMSFPDLDTPRRTLYLRTIRSDRSNYRMLFDAADAESIVDRRNESTVAPQALFLLNSPSAIRWIRDFADRAIRDVPGDESARMDLAYRLLIGRPPTEPERAIGLGFIRNARGRGEAEADAWAAFGQILACSNAFLYVD